MLHLYIAECRRFARWAAGVAALHLAALVLAAQLFPGIRESSEICMIVATVYGVSAAVFGFYQAATYARMNHWIALLHRPLAPWRIMAGVVGGGATIVIAVILLPLLAFTASQALQVLQVVDVRHWLLALAGGLIALVGFLAGGFAALAPRRYGWTGVVAVLVMMASINAAGAGALLYHAALIAILVLLLAGAFKPDRSMAASHPVLLTVTTGVAAFCAYFVLLLVGGFGYQMTLAALGRNALINTPPPGGLVEASRADTSDLIAAALAAAPGTEASALRPRLHGVETRRLGGAVQWLPTWSDLTNSGPASFSDARRSIQWTFSHDANAYRGVRMKVQQPAAPLRVAGGFEAPPLLVSDGRMIAGGSVYAINAARGTIDRLMHLPDGEVVVAKPVTLGETVAVLGDRAVHLFDRAAFEAGGVVGAVRTIPLPGLIGDLRRLDVLRLPDRTIVSFFFGRDSIEGPLPAWQRVVSVDASGVIRTLAQRSLGPDFSDALRFRTYLLSPAVEAVASAAERIGAVDNPGQRRAPARVPGAIWIAAGALSLVAAAAAFALARRRRLSKGASWIWTVATLAVGLPMLVAFWLVDQTPRLTR